MEALVILILVSVVIFIVYRLVRPYTPEERESINMASRADLANAAKRTGMGGSPGKPSPRPVYGAEIFANAGGPRTFDDYVGQTRAKMQLKIATLSAAKRGERVGHILIATGLHGVGKSAIARVIANSLNVGIVEVQGELTGEEAMGIFSGMKDHDILFIDEAHKLADKGKARIEWLLPVLQDGVMTTAQGPKKIPNVTIILATTDKDLLPETILSRLPLKPVLEPYTPQEGAQIAAYMAKGIFSNPPSAKTLQAISSAANETPREIAGLLANLRDYEMAGVIERDENDNLDVMPMLELMDITPDGLDTVAQNMLLALLASGGSLGMTNLAAKLGEPTIPRHTEKMLLQKGLMTIAQAVGRALTETGKERATALAEKFATAE